MQIQTRRDWNWVTAILFVLMIASLSVRLVVTGWVPGMERLQLVALLAACLGLALGVSRFKSPVIHLIIGGYSLFIIPWLLGGMIALEGQAYERLASLGLRLGYSINRLFNGQPVQDPVFFLTTMSFLLWGIAIFSGIQVTRHANKLSILLPASVPLLIIQYYDGAETQRLWIVAFYFFCALLLLGRLNFVDMAASLRGKQVAIDLDAHLDASYAIFGVTALLVLVAWFMPLPGSAIPAAVLWWNDVTTSFQQTRDNLGDALAALQGGGRQGNTRFGSVLGLGISAATGDEIIFLASPQDSNLPRYYWRARVYDTYQQGYWTTRQARDINITTDGPNALIPDTNSRTLTETRVEWQGNAQTLLVSLPQPVWASRPGSLSYSPITGGPLDVMALLAEEPVQPGDKYTTRAQASNPTISSLRNSGTAYPAWVRQRYLQVPDDFSPRIIALAQEITAGQASAYDKTVAITTYLRREIEYSETIPAPPPGTDSLEWFLFTTRQGYCNYYATAQVMMLRAVGVPARLAVGYAQGQVSSTGTYTVRSRDTHAWPEVYFEGIGWVEFEPTGNQPDLVRPSLLGGSFPAVNPEARPDSEQEILPSQGTPTPEVPDGQAANGWANMPLQAVLVWFIIVILIFLLVRSAWQANRAQPFAQRIPRLVQNAYQRIGQKPPRWLTRWLAWSELGSVEKSFQAVNQALAWLGSPQPAHSTPAERAEQLGYLMPRAQHHILALQGELEKSLFTPHPGNASLAFRAAWAIRYHTVRRIISRWLNGV